MRQRLAQLSVFSQLDNDRLNQIAQITHSQSVPAGEKIFAEGQHADHFSAVLHGRVALSLTGSGTKSFPLCTVSAGEVLGWTALLPQKRWHVAAYAVKDSTLVVIPGAKLLALCADDHELGYQVMHSVFQCVAQRLQDTWLQLSDLHAK